VYSLYQPSLTLSSLRTVVDAKMKKLLQEGQWSRIPALYELAEYLGLLHDAPAFPGFLLKACRLSKNVDVSLFILEALPSELRSISHANETLNQLVRAGRNDDAWELLSEMRIRFGLLPNSISFALALQGQPERVRELWAWAMLSSAVTTDVANNAIRCSAIRCLPDLALQIVSYCHGHGVTMDNYTFTHAFVACYRPRERAADTASALFHKYLTIMRMQPDQQSVHRGQRLLIPDLIACNAAAKALRTWGLTVELEMLKQVMKAYGIKPDLYTLNALVSSARRGYEPSEAEPAFIMKDLETMTLTGVIPQGSTLELLMDRFRFDQSYPFLLCW
jgi:hypothetical protein